MSKNERQPADGNPSPPKTKTVISASREADLNAVDQSELNQREDSQEMAMNEKLNSERNPSPPRAGSTIGNA